MIRAGSSAAPPPAPDWRHLSSLTAALETRALRTPDSTAFMWLENGEREDRMLTYRQLRDRAHAIAELIKDADLHGEPILLVYTTGPDVVAALFGCFQAGAVGVVAPAPNFKSADRLGLIAADAGSAAVLTTRALAPMVRGQVGGNRRILITDALSEPVGRPATTTPDPDGLAMLQYTSGSTAVPRGVMLTHANVLANLRAQAQAAELRAGETAIGWLPFHHDMGLFGFGLLPVLVGLRSVLMPPVAFLKRPTRWLEAIARYGASLSAGPCFAYDLCVRRTSIDRRGSLDLSSWRIAVCGGEMIRPDVLERFAVYFQPVNFRPSAFMPAYGMAESTVLASTVGVGEGLSTTTVDAPNLSRRRAAPPLCPDRARRLASCGRAWRGHEVIIVEPGSRKRLLKNRVGEIWLRGDSISPGYWRRPNENAETFNATLAGPEGSTGWLRTGDLGFIGDHGLIVTGRSKDMIIVRGANFDPLDLEVAAEACDQVIATGGSVAFSFHDDEGEKVVIACEIERSAAKVFDPTSVIKNVVATVNSKFGLPLHDLIFLLPRALPRTTSGKLQRHACRELYLSGALPNMASGRFPELGRCRPVGAPTR